MDASTTSDWDDQDWEPLLYRIRADKCVPFLGAGISAGILPTGAALAETLATKFGYPLSNVLDLGQVSQYAALRHDRRHVKEEVLRILEKHQQSAQKGPHTPHAQLARLPVSIYTTTNYDSLMYDALKAQRPRDPRYAVCNWNASVTRETSVEDLDVPTIVKPIVFHLHGNKENPSSLVLTEDDYLDFLTKMAQGDNLIPNVIKSAIQNSTILFIGYRLADWNFRILFRQLSNYKDISSVAVFPPPSETDPSAKKVKEYLTRHYAAMQVKIFWGTAQVFMERLITGYATKFGKNSLVGFQ